MTLTHFKEDDRKANPRAAMVRVEIRDAQGYANQRRHDLPPHPKAREIAQKQRREADQGRHDAQQRLLKPRMQQFRGAARALLGGGDGGGIIGQDLVGWKVLKLRRICLHSGE